DDGVGRLFRLCGAGQRTHLQAVFGVGDGVLVGHLAVAEALHAGTQPGAVHHGEHAVQPLVDLADQETGGAVEVHHAGGGSLDAHLVLDGAADHAVALTLFAVGVRQELGHDEQRDAFGTGRCVGQLGEYQVHDIFSHVVLAGGDEDLGSGDGVGAIRLWHGAGLDQAQVGTAVGFGKAHGAGPVARYQLVEIQLLLLLGAVGANGRSAAVGQARVHVPGIVG